MSLFLPLERRFWYGLAAAVTFLFVVGVVGAILIRRELLVRVAGHPPDGLGHHAGRTESPPADRQSGR